MAYILNSSFLRGLGIGLIISGLVITFTKSTLNDNLGSQPLNKGKPPQSTATPSKVTENKSAQGTSKTNKNNTNTSNTSQNKTNPGSTNTSNTNQILNNQNNLGSSPTTPSKTTPGAPISFVIPKGSDSSKIADLLMQAGLIKDKQKFLIIVNNMKAARRFKADTFTIPTGASEVDIVLILTK